ncbi:MAG TPA: helix-turn-helix transcriptional regulator [Anaerolineaceae bacterium]|nr:helix-turn-helix transcriptional regulator [Anaerolineaceae bacterium]
MSIKMAISENSAEVSGSDYAGVGECLRTLRLRSGHSLRSLAERSGLNINTLSLIEHNRTSPSVHTLERLARALDVPITAFFEPEKDLKQVVFTRHDARPNATFEMASVGEPGEEPGCQLASIVCYDPGAGGAKRRGRHET